MSDFTKQQLERYAEVLLWGLKKARTGRFRKGDIILMQYDLAALPLLEVLQGRLLDMGMNVVIRGGFSKILEHNFYSKSNTAQLTFVPPGEKELYQNLNGRIFLRGAESLTHLSDIDPAKIGKFIVSRKFLREIMDAREEKGVYSWTLCSVTTPAVARHAGLTPRQYTNQIVRACYLDVKDPVAEWERIFKALAGIKKWLTSLPVRYYRVETANMDLRVTPGESRKWIGISGHNIPSFEIFISPDWRGTEGTYFSNLPSFRSGNFVENVRLIFRRGSVVKATAEKGEEFTRKQVAMDKGASKVGEFSLTDKRFSRINRFMADTLFDENFGGSYGNMHIALGSSYSTYAGDISKLNSKLKEKMGFNDSALHWDFINTEKKTVTAHLKTGKDVVVYENGIFKY